MIFLVDTNVVSELRKSRPNRGVFSWFGKVDDDHLRLSVLVIGELRQGIERLMGRDPLQATRFADWLDAVKLEFSERIVPVTAEVAEEWGRMNAKATVPFADGLMAATAVVNNWTLVTRNVKHVARTGVKVLNPFGD